MIGLWVIGFWVPHPSGFWKGGAFDFWSAGPTLRKRREGWGTQLFLPGNFAKKQVSRLPAAGKLHLGASLARALGMTLNPF
jgi:hypothetical protein